jgi:CAAX prenyl protease-like protein
VFCLWIAPELVDPHYRSFSLFSNAVMGHVGSSLRPEALRSGSVLFWRTVRAATVVPVAEELFWRAWLMRWLINHDFQRVPLGTYMPGAFWLTAFLFAAEHGPYWDVGLVTGILYNLWMIRSKSLGDCVLMHAVTNLLLSLYVIAYGQWRYWQ